MLLAGQDGSLCAFNALGMQQHSVSVSNALRGEAYNTAMAEEEREAVDR